jgi:hypothetical protein
VPKPRVLIGLLTLGLAVVATGREAAAAQLMSLQSGTVTVSGGVASVVTLPTAVNMTKAFVVFGTTESTADPLDGQVSGQLTTPTTVTFRQAGGTASVTVKYYVAEFASGVSVQRGSIDIATGNVFNVTLGTPVDTTKSFPLISYRSAGTNFNCNDFVRAKLTTGANLQLSSDVTNCGVVATSVVEWQVVQYQDASVRSGDVAFAAGSTVQTANLAPGVNTAKSWLVYSYEGTPDATPNVGLYLVRGLVTNPTTLTFDRSNSGTVSLTLTWYLIEFTDSTTVQSGTQAFPTGVAANNVTLPLPAPTGNSLAVGGGDYQRGGRSSYSTNDVVGVGWFNFDLTAPNNLQIVRGSGLAPADVGWFVLTFPCDCSPLGVTEVPRSTITVTAPNSFETVFRLAAGASLDSFFDLAEDPARAYDLAGKPTSELRGLFHSSMVVGGNLYVTGQNNRGPKMDLLEATPTRVRVRSEMFFQQRPSAGTAVLGGVKGIADYSVYSAGKLGVRWNRRVTANVTYTDHPLEMALHYEAAPADPRSSLTGFSQNAAFPAPPSATAPASGGDDFVLGRYGAAGARTGFLGVLYQDWPQADELDYANATSFFSWRDTTSTTLTPAANASQFWNLLIDFKPTNFVSNTDPAVTSRSADYRGPAVLTVTAGSGWFDPSENTAAPNDYFNEAEAAYTLNLDPAAGVTFTMDGSTTPRYKPFFKIRQWRSLGPPLTATLNGATLTRDVHFRTDLKPVSRAHLAQITLWHSTLQDAAASLTSPDIGSAGSAGGATPVAARYGNGLRIAGMAGGDYVGFSTADFDPANGAVEFWYQPDYASNDGVSHYLAGFRQNNANELSLEKAADNNLYFTINTGTASTYVVAAADYSWRAADWVHLRIEWNAGVASCPPSCAGQQRILINGVEPAHTDPTTRYDGTFTNLPGTFRIGSYTNANNNGSATAAGSTYDEIYAYGGSSTTPTPLAHGGLTAAASEYLGDPAKNYPLAFAGVDATRRGVYFYVGADSQFRGLNVGLTQAGAGVVANALLWEYWNGASWADLTTTPGFTDQTSSLTRSGAIYWTGDPATWSLYSVNGGPDLYYVRAHLPTGAAYTTAPIEGLIKTDIILFQYCGDVTAAAQVFHIAAPLPTAVRLMSFEATGADGAVDLSWRTGSELHNLGFNLYRSLSGSGPWTRITSSLIPGLGSSPVGASYSWRDGGLTNGTRYFYRLEDVDSHSGSTFHGPVSAVPSAPAPPPPGQGEGSGSGDSGGSGSSLSGCPAWVLSAYGPSSSSGFSCQAYGDPDSTSLRVVSRSSHGVVVELLTSGFVALRESSGFVRAFIPGFDFPTDPSAPALPLRRVVLDALVGRHVRVDSVEAFSFSIFRGLVPAAVGSSEAVSFSDGTVRPMRRPARLRRSSRGYLPPELAQLAGVVFQGEEKRAVVEISPLRFDTSRQALVLARKVRARLSFEGHEAREAGRGSRGRCAPRRGRFSGEPLAQLYTSREGLYAVAFSELSSHFRPIATSLLGLERQGLAVPFHVEPDPSIFGPGSVLFFYADTSPSSTDFSSESAYELVRSSSSRTMDVVSAPPSGAPPALSSEGSASFEVNRIYQAGLLDAPDPWLWEAIWGGTSKSETFSLTGVDSSSSLPARLVVYLQGGSDVAGVTDHHVRLLVNGAVVGETSFDGEQAQRFEVSFPVSTLVEGTNSLSVQDVGDTGVYSLVFLDRFSVAFPQTPVLRGGLFEGTWAERGSAEISGSFASPVVLDVTAAAADSGSGAVDAPAPSPVAWLTGLGSTPSSLLFAAEAGHRYLVVSQQGLLHPRTAFPAPSSLRSGQNQADFILIAPRAFLPAAQPLLDRRRAQGLASRGVSLEEISSVFGHGQASAQAIHDFLSFAFHSWAAPSPRYVLLLGESTYDPRNFTSDAHPSPLPALWVKTSYLWTVSDPTLAAVNGDDTLPDLAIGRLPATTPEEAQGMIAKILDWEDSGQSLDGRAVLVADNPDDGGDFEADVRDIAGSLLAGRDTQEIFLSRLGGGTRNAILSAFDDGASLMSYVGHGGPAVWASEDILNSWDPPSLLRQDEQPLMITVNCLNGYFVAPNFDALTEAFLKAEGRGAIAGFSPSGLSLDAPAHLLHRALIGEILSPQNPRLGDALLAAQKDYVGTGAFPELISIYHLLGDPTMRIR